MEAAAPSQLTRARALLEALTFCALFGGVLIAREFGGDELMALVPSAYHIPVEVYVLAQVSIVFCVAVASRDADMAASLGLSRKNPLWSLMVGVAGYVGVLLVAAAAAFFVVYANLLSVAAPDIPPVTTREQEVVRAFTEIPLPLVVPLAAFVGFYEELCFRGFLLGRLRTALGEGRAAAIVAVGFSSIVFALGHTYKGRLGVVATFVLSVVLGAIAWRQRRITATVVTHALLDTTVLFAARAALPAAALLTAASTFR